MLGLKKRQRILLIAALAATLGLSALLIGYGFSAGINFFRAPTQVLAERPGPSEVFRLGGLIETGTLVRHDNSFVTFKVTDGAASIPLEYKGILPDLVAENGGVVAKGSYVNGVFQATEILAKHDETYMPKEVIDALKAQGVYKPEGEGRAQP